MSSSDSRHQRLPDPVIVGLSIGQLPAAAIALAPTIPALLPLAVEITLISFRLGLYIQHAAHNLEPSITGKEARSWSVQVPTGNADKVREILRDVHSRKVFANPHIKALGQDNDGGDVIAQIYFDSSICQCHRRYQCCDKWTTFQPRRGRGINSVPATYRIAYLWALSCTPFA